MATHHEAERLRILGEALDGILAQPTRERQVAALGCFAEGLQGRKPLPQDELKLISNEA